MVDFLTAPAFAPKGRRTVATGGAQPCTHGEAQPVVGNKQSVSDRPGGAKGPKNGAAAGLFSLPLIVVACSFHRPPLAPHRVLHAQLPRRPNHPIILPERLASLQTHLHPLPLPRMDRPVHTLDPVRRHRLRQLRKQEKVSATVPITDLMTVSSARINYRWPSRTTQGRHHV